MQKNEQKRGAPAKQNAAESPARAEPEMSLLLRQLEKLLQSLEAMGLDDYLALRNDRWKMLRRSFWMGAARGLGTALGFTVLGAIAIYVLQKTVAEHLPALAAAAQRMLRLIEGK